MRQLLTRLIAVAALVATCAVARPAVEPVRILFVGNSLTYVGNLPAVLDAMAASSGRATASGMIVKGGATLAERASDGSVGRALDAQHYDYVVLQERGGDMICAYAPARCRASESALRALVKTAAMHHAKPILLGTYQSSPDASRELLKTETAAATRLSMAYVPVADGFLKATTSAPSAHWLYADHMHPGHDLVLLEAALLYRELFGNLPRVEALTVHAPMFKPGAKFSLPAPTSEALAPQTNEQSCAYTADTVATVLALASGQRGSK